MKIAGEVFMLRRSFIQNSLTAATFNLFSMESNADENSFDGGFLDQDSDGSINFYSHDFQENVFYKKQLFEDGFLLNSENKAIYKKENLFLFPYNHPKINSNLMISMEFNAQEKKISQFHFLNVLPESQNFEFLYTYATTENELHGKEELKLLFDNSFDSNNIATIFYLDKETYKVGSFQKTKNGSQLCFQTICDLGELSAQFLTASWHGPYHDLIGQEKNVFFAVQEGVGIYFFQFDGESIHLLTQIEHNQNFENFTYYFPKLTENNLEENKTRFFSVIVSHAPQGISSSPSALMLTSDTGVHFLSYNLKSQNFTYQEYLDRVF